MYLSILGLHIPKVRGRSRNRCFALLVRVRYVRVRGTSRNRCFDLSTVSGRALALALTLTHTPSVLVRFCGNLHNGLALGLGVGLGVSEGRVRVSARIR